MRPAGGRRAGRPRAACVRCGEVPEWPKGADCKSAGSAYGGSNPPLSTTDPGGIEQGALSRGHRLGGTDPGVPGVGTPALFFGSPALFRGVGDRGVGRYRRELRPGGVKALFSGRRGVCALRGFFVAGVALVVFGRGACLRSLRGVEGGRRRGGEGLGLSVGSFPGGVASSSLLIAVPAPS